MRHHITWLAVCVGAWGVLPFRAAADDISGSGWRLWPDTQAKWKDDTLYLPQEVGPGWLHDDPKGAHADGLLLDAPGLEAFVGYGADHNTKVGMGGCLIPYGKGQIVFYCLPQLVRSLQPSDFAISQPVADR